ncbi:hypothetical protein Syun_030712 [Stephania yunnanensis]|uniref:Sodium/calcium exchanger membrane region domain-containing protein n=1 Tax=Stephania yunnanensis TaxID=152371 RepID=A0AAP0DYJ7_9MAGN
MATMFCIFQSKTYLIFLNITFLVLLFLVLKTTQFSFSENFVVSFDLVKNGTSQDGCKGFQKLKGYKTKCLYLKSHKPCSPDGYIDYLYIFYCICGKWPLLGYVLAFLWLLVLFYVLGNTASVYFCSSLENLSRVLKLSPSIAGVTLLSLGNGAPDVFASLVSFARKGGGGVGLNSVLGGAFFVSCVVVGIVSISTTRHRITINRLDFLRDVCFFLLGVLSLSFIVIIGKINIWGAIAFSSLYLFYVLVVYVTHNCWKNNVEICTNYVNPENDSELGVPIFHHIEWEDIVSTEREASEVNGYKEVEVSTGFRFYSPLFRKCLDILGLPLYLPRRLTIPVVSEEKWSKPFAVASVTLGPIFLAFVCCSKRSLSFEGRVVVYAASGLIGVLLGILSFLTTESSAPPKKYMFLWLIGGFVMSVTWSYVTAQELVALLVSLGIICIVSPSVLGLTLLAWGNSIGDLITNVTMSVNGGQDGTQVAISGCYAGPIFNMLVGLGLSLVVSSWKAYPSSVTIPRDPFLFETLCFVVAGLLWAVLILPLKRMRLDRFLGVGLLAIYLFSISMRLLQTAKSLWLK